MSSSAAPERSPWIVDLRWAREAQQERSKRTQAALLDATEAELETSSVDELSVADIAGRAGVSIGSVYHHFKSKQALIYAMLDRLHDEWLATIDDATDHQRWADAPLLDVVRGFTEYSLLRLRESEGVSRARLQLALDDSEIAAQEAKASAYVHERVYELLWARRAEIGLEKPSQAIHYVLDQVAAMARFRIATPGVHITTTTDEEFVTATVESVRAYLQVR
jgi:AcrR family transcriptional regulator